MLDGESIELSRSDVPLAERDLLGSSEITVRCTAEQLLERMSDAFDEVKTVVARFGDAWDALTPRVNAAQTALDEVQSLAAGARRSPPARPRRRGSRGRAPRDLGERRPALDERPQTSTR